MGEISESFYSEYIKKEREKLKNKLEESKKSLKKTESLIKENPWDEDIKELLRLEKEHLNCILTMYSLLEHWEAHNENVD